MTATEIIALFEQQVDDLTELSSASELTLLNKVYQMICDFRTWEFLKKEASGTMTTTTTITAPADMAHFVENMTYTDNSEDIESNAKPAGILINGNKWLQIINWSDRRQYINVDGYAYYDVAAGIIHTTYAQPSGATYSFDYKYFPADLGVNDSPKFPAIYHPMIYYAMAEEDFIIQLFDKARSTGNENMQKFNSYLQRMCLWDANLRNN